LDKFQSFLLFAPVLLFSMVAHEYAHGYAALKQGDTTALQLGRLTWNPLKHIDPFMTVIMPLVLYFSAGMLFGGAKPVPVDPRNYRHHVRGDIIVSLAGIFVNLCLAVICTGLIIVAGALGRAIPSIVSTAAVIQAMLFAGVGLNVLLAFFNLLPIPPLDGSHVFKYLLPPAWALRYERIGFLGIVLLIFFLPKLRGVYEPPIRFMTGLSNAVTENSYLPETLQILFRTGLIGLQ
jgi:Zn-dependent protease